MASTNFALGRSEFNVISPGTVIAMDQGGSFGRIKSVANKDMCLDIGEHPYPIDAECKPIESDFSTTDQAWHLSKNNFLKFLDLNRDDEENPDYFLCLYAFGDKEDGTGFVRARDCPGKGHASPEEEPNAKWEMIDYREGSHEYKIRNIEIDMCLGEEITQVKAGRPGLPGPARTRTTWQLTDCKIAPEWKFLHLFESRDLDDKLCKIKNDADACYRHKNANREEFPAIGIFNEPVGQMEADYAFAPTNNEPEREMTPEDEEYYEAYMAALRASYEYYLDPSFDPYDYNGY